MLCMSPFHLIMTPPPSFNPSAQCRGRASTKRGEKWWNHGWRLVGTTVPKEYIRFCLCDVFINFKIQPNYYTHLLTHRLAMGGWVMRVARKINAVD